MELGSFKDMFFAELQEARSVEAILCDALPKMAAAAKTPALKQALKAHLEETKSHLETVEQILTRQGVSPTDHQDQAMQALVGEAEKMMGMMKSGPLRDAALIASAQRVEHYEMAVYGTLANYAECLGLDDEVQLLAGILEDEKLADEKLSEVASGSVNPSAVEAG